jgi:hypothetical protein
MKAVLIVAVLATVSLIFVQYTRSRDIKKLLVAIASFGLIIALGIMGNLTRSVIPLFMAHLILLVAAWGALILYLLRNRYYWWLIFSPIVTIVLFLILELLTGSGHEYLGEMT